MIELYVDCTKERRISRMMLAKDSRITAAVIGSRIGVFVSFTTAHSQSRMEKMGYAHVEEGSIRTKCASVEQNATAGIAREKTTRHTNFAFTCEFARGTFSDTIDRQFAR